MALIPQRLLDHLVRCHVNGGRRLVQHQNLGPAEQSTRERDELPLPNAEVGAVGLYRGLELGWESRDEWLEVGALKCLPDLGSGLWVMGL